MSYKEYAFEITAPVVANADFVGFAELQFYDCAGTQLVPSSASNPGGNDAGYGNGAANAFDGSLISKWLDSNRQLLIATFSTAVQVASYKWISAEGGSWSGNSVTSTP